MSWDTRIGIASLIMAFAGIACAILWPSKRRLGWLSLAVAILLGAYWTYVEVWSDFWEWLSGTHGPWFYMFIGGCASICLLVLAGALRVAVTRIRALREQRKGFLDYKYDAEKAIATLPSTANKLSIIMNDVGASFTRHTAMLQRAGSTDDQLTAIRRAAENLNKCSARVERICVTFVETGSLLSNGLIGWSKWIQGSRPNRAALGDFPEVLREFIQTLDTSNNQLRAYLVMMDGAKGAAATMDIALERHIRSLQVILDANINIHQACSQTLRIIESLT